MPEEGMNEAVMTCPDFIPDDTQTKRLLCATLARMIKLVERGAIKSLLARTFPLKDFVQAQEEFMQKKHVGNIVVTMM